MARPRLLLVGNHLGVRGLPMSVGEELAWRLGERGWAVRTTSSQEDKLRRLADMLGTLVVRRGDYDVVHLDVFSGAAFVWAEAVSVAAKRLGKPLVYTLHGGLLPALAARSPRRVARLLARAAIVTAPSTYLAEALAPLAPRGIEVVPNAVDRAAYAKYAGQGDERTIVWLRAFHAVYNPAAMPVALRVLHDAGERLQLRMIGPDKGDGSLAETRAAVARLGLAEHVHFGGGVKKTEVAGEMARGVYYVNSTTADNHPVTVVEAMCAGRAIVSSNVGGIPHLLEDGKTGVLSASTRGEDLGAALLGLVRDPARRRRLAAAALAASARYDWPDVLAAWESVYMRALSA